MHQRGARLVERNIRDPRQATLQIIASLLALGTTLAVANVAAQTSRPPPRFITDDPACSAATLVATGGPAPRSPTTLAIRWTGFSNFELAYKGNVLLLDAYFDRGAVYPPLGFSAEDVRRADAILIGHGHVDHMADAASVAARTGATVVGAAFARATTVVSESSGPRTWRRNSRNSRFPRSRSEPCMEKVKKCCASAHSRLSRSPADIPTHQSTS